MKVHIICGNIENNWILGKFATKLQECLTKLGVSCDISPFSDNTADINHAIHYAYASDDPRGIETMMITHLDELEKLNLIRNKMERTSMGICMSNDTMHWLAKMGIRQDKLSYVNPAHDGCALIKRYSIGIASRVYPDGRKNEWYFNKLAEDLNPLYFHFKFMGAGWEEQVKKLKEKGFEVTYYDRFIRSKYFRFIQSLDYYLYTGTDEGQMGYLDAAASGIKTIVTPQGYHLDAPEALTLSFWTYDDLKEILLSLQKERESIVHSMDNWSWMAYAKKHVELWNFLLGENVQGEYEDGIASYFRLKEENIIVDSSFVETEESRLMNLSDLHCQSRQNNKVPSNILFRVLRKIALLCNKQIYRQ